MINEFFIYAIASLSFWKFTLSFSSFSISPRYLSCISRILISVVVLLSVSDLSNPPALGVTSPDGDARRRSSSNRSRYSFSARFSLSAILPLWILIRETKHLQHRVFDPIFGACRFITFNISKVHSAFNCNGEN